MTADFVAELRAFTTFLSSVWGILGSVSAFFPLSNTFLRVLPIDPPAAAPWLGPKLIDPPLISALATLSCIYVVFHLFSQRRAIGERTRVGIQRSASRSFGLGIVSVLVYLADFYVVPNAIQAGAVLPPTDPVLLLYDLTLIVFYSGFFALTTRAFVLLGLMEYLGVT